MGHSIGFITRHNFDEPDNKNRLVIHANNERNNDSALMFCVLVFSKENAHYALALKNKSFFEALDSVSGNRLAIYLHHTSIGHEAPSQEKVEKFKKEFGISKEAPILLFFQVDEMNIIDMMAIPINGNNKDEVFNNLFKYISAASKALKGIINRQNRYNYREMFNLVAIEIQSQFTKDIINFAVNKVSPSSLLDWLFK